MLSKDDVLSVKSIVHFYGCIAVNNCSTSVVEVTKLSTWKVG